MWSLWLSANTISMANCKKDLTPLLTHWSLVFLALTHRYGDLASIVDYNCTRMGQINWEWVWKWLKPGHMNWKLPRKQLASIDLKHAQTSRQLHCRTWQIAILTWSRWYQRLTLVPPEAFLSQLYSIMTSSNGNIFCVTGLLCGESTGHWWISPTKASDAELWRLSTPA